MTVFWSCGTRRVQVGSRAVYKEGGEEGYFGGDAGTRAQVVSDGRVAPGEDGQQSEEPLACLDEARGGKVFAGAKAGAGEGGRSWNLYTAISSTALLFLLPLALLLDVAHAQEQQQLPFSAFGTRPYNSSVQAVPGKVWFAWYDQGGEGKAFHTVDAVNHGSCELNPCRGVNATYLNTFRADEAVSVSYTKPWFWWSNKAWSDRWAVGTPQAGKNVPLDEFYVGWFVQGSWLRLTVNVTQSGRYAADMYITCPNSGDLVLSLNKYESGELVSKRVVKDVPKTVYFHDWEILEGGAILDVPEAGLHVLTVDFAKVGGDPKVHWGNLIWMDFHEV